MRKQTNKSQIKQQKAAQEKKLAKIKTKKQEPVPKTNSLLKKKVVAQLVQKSSQPLGQKLKVDIKADLDDKSIDLAFASLVGFLASKSLFTPSQDVDPQRVINGLTYMFEGVISKVKGGTENLSSAPIVIYDLIDALSPKVVPFLGSGQASYAWTSVSNFSIPTIPMNGGAVWNVTQQNDDQSSVSSCPVLSGTPSEEDYSYLLQLLGGLAVEGAMRIVTLAEYTSPMKKDVSAFARVYPYNGLAPSESGAWYKDIESEVEITAPAFSSFSKYSTQTNYENRVPMKLHAYSGDAAVTMGLPLTNLNSSYFNKRAPVFKLIDFEEIYAVLVHFAVSTVKNLYITGAWVENASIGMTEQDFRVLLRQALLTVFDAQYAVQFLGPLNFGTQQNGFVPFEIMGNTSSTPSFGQMNIPLILKENLAALRARTIVPAGTTSKINKVNYIPVLGRYVLDSPVTPVVVIDNGGGTWDLFLPPSGPNINLIDGTIGNSQYVNLSGSYYKTVLANWNYFMTQAAKVIADYGPIQGDQGAAGLGAIFYTGVVASVDDTYRVPRNIAIKYAKFADIIKNKNGSAEQVEQKMESVKIGRSMERTGSDPKLVKRQPSVKALAPATLATLTKKWSTSAFKISAEQQQFLDFIITPCMRLDPNNTNDQLSIEMYQIEAREPISAFYSGEPNESGGAEWSRLGAYAGSMVTGIGKQTNNEFACIIKRMVESGEAGMLASILGGVAKSFFPEASGVIDTVSSIVPF